MAYYRADGNGRYSGLIGANPRSPARTGTARNRSTSSAGMTKRFGGFRAKPDVSAVDRLIRGTHDANRSAFLGQQGWFNPDPTAQRYLGGFPDDYVSRTTVPVEWNTNSYYGAMASINRANPRNESVYGRPVYREGDQVTFSRDLNADGVRDWQRFFQILGFKTGPSGFWTHHEMVAMQALMSMANGTPGGGMTVQTLRDRLLTEVQAGIWEPGQLPEALGVGGTGGGGGGGGGLGEVMEGPITETITETQTTEFSTDQGMLMLRNFVAEQLGRAPTNSEVKAYVKELNAALRADPTVITTVITTDPVTNEVTTERDMDETGVEPEARAIMFADEMSPAERKEHMTGRYMDALMREIGM